MENNYDDIDKEDKTYLERNFYDQFFKGIALLIIITIMLGFFIGLSDDSDFQGEDMLFAEFNLTKKTTTMASTTTGKYSLQVVSPY